MTPCSSCGGGGRATIAASTAARSASRAAAAIMPPGYSEADPVVIGEANDADPIRVRVVHDVAPLKMQQAAWVTGTGVTPLLDSGDFVDITGREQLARRYRVGAYVYSDKDKADRVAAALGTVAVEVA